MFKDITVKCYENLPQDARLIREEVFVNEQGFKEEFDTVDLYAYHFIAYNDDTMPIGTCRIFGNEDPAVYYLGRLAVVKEARSIGIGSLLILNAEIKAKNFGAKEMRLHSQCRAQKFYEKCGYAAYGEVEMEEGYPHIWMRKVL